MIRKNKTKEDSYNHFKERLLERCDLDISYKEYLKLKPNKVLYKATWGALFCSVLFKNKELLCIQNVRRTELPSYKLMRTVFSTNNLPIDEYPLPQKAKKFFGYTDFKILINHSLNRIEIIKELNLSNKQLFQNYPEHIAFQVKHSVDNTSFRHIKDKAMFIFGLAGYYSNNYKEAVEIIKNHYKNVAEVK